MEFAAEAGMRTFFTSISIFFVLLVAIVALAGCRVRRDKPAWSSE
jgi:hypothetical protein